MAQPPAGRFSSLLASEPDVVCLSHLRWNFVFQRPQHLLSRIAETRRVFFFEEPVPTEGATRLDLRLAPEGVTVAVPHIAQRDFDVLDRRNQLQREMLDGLLFGSSVRDFVLWYYTPMALSFSRHLAPRATVYDCTDELSAFAGAPPEMRAREQELLGRADVVFTGGQSLYEAKHGRHPNVHCFPSSVDIAHFRRARNCSQSPADQANLRGPRIGFAGVIDERMNRELVGAVAAARPDWQIVMLGPVVKVDPASLPRPANIHYLGMKSYDDLPLYLAGWDVAMLPFAHNESTRFISPTKTPEYLAAGRPVVSTAIRDVVRPYGELGLAHIADSPSDFIQAIERALSCDRVVLCRRADAFLAVRSWDRTVGEMLDLVEDAVAMNYAGLGRTVAEGRVRG